MKKILILGTFTFLGTTAFSQEKPDTNSVKKNIKTIVIQDSRIDQLNTAYKDSYQLKGFRVQIYSGNKRQPANQARSKFLRNHPKTKAHLDYIQPHFKVRVGDFRTKLEALKYKNRITTEFPNCFIVTDNIDISELD